MTRLWQRLLFALLLVAILFVGARRRAVWREELVDKGIGGDGLHYWWMAVHLEKEHAISLDGKVPTWTRLPGFPALLAVTTSPQISWDGPSDKDAIKARVQAWLKRMKRVNNWVDLLAAVPLALLGLLLGGGLGALIGAAAWAVLPWSSVLAMHPLSDPLSTTLTALALVAIARALRDGRAGQFALAGALVALGQYVRPDAIFLVPLLVLAGLVRRGPLRERLRLGAIAVATYLVVFAPWPIRNKLEFGEAHFFAGVAGVDAKGKPLDREPAFRWLRTWVAGGETATVNVAWKFPSLPMWINEVPGEAFDSPEERAEVQQILMDYNHLGAKLDDGLVARLDAVSRARRSRDWMRFWVRLPWARLSSVLFPPRDGFRMGTLPTLQAERDGWIRADRVMVLVGLFGLVVAARRSWMARLLLLWLLVRFAVPVWLPVTEPRYLLPTLPVIYAGVAALVGEVWRAAARLAAPTRRSA